MRDEKIAGFWVFLSWALLLILVTVITSYNGLYGQDSYEYLRYCLRLSAYIHTGIAPGDYFWPVNYPLSGALLSFITGPQVALQLITILSAAWIVYLTCMYLLKEFPGREREVILYVILFLGLSPYFFRYSLSVMSDLPALAFAATAWYGLYKGNRNTHLLWLGSSLFFAAMSIFTRFALLPMMLPVFIAASYLLVRKFSLMSLLISILVAVIPAAIYIFFKQEASGQIFQHYLLTDWTFLNFFKNKFTNIDGSISYTFPNILFVLSFLFHPGFLFPGAFLLFILIWKRKLPSLANPVLVSGMILYLLFIAGIPNRNIRYLIPVLPFYIAICFPSYLYISSWFYKRKSLRITLNLTTCAIQLILVVLAFRPFYKLNQIEKYVAGKIIDYHPKVLYTFGIDGAVRSYGFSGTIINLWDQPLKSVSENALLLFNRQKDSAQWKGLNPMINYELIIDKGKAVKIEDLGSGWEIYEVSEAYPNFNSGIPEERN